MDAQGITEGSPEEYEFQPQRGRAKKTLRLRLLKPKKGGLVFSCAVAAPLHFPGAWSVFPWFMAWSHIPDRCLRRTAVCGKR